MRHSYFEWAISGSPTPPDPKPRESLSRPAAPHSDPRKTPGPGSSWAYCGPRLVSSPTPAASSQASSSVVALPTTTEMQRPLSWGLWATHLSGSYGSRRGLAKGRNSRTPGGSGGRRKKARGSRGNVWAGRVVGGWDDRGCINPPCLWDRGQRAPTRSWSRVSLSAWSRYRAALHEPTQAVWQSRPLETLVSQNSGRPATGLSAHAGAASLLSFLASFPPSATHSLRKFCTSSRL